MFRGITRANDEKFNATELKNKINPPTGRGKYLILPAKFSKYSTHVRKSFCGRQQR